LRLGSEGGRLELADLFLAKFEGSVIYGAFPKGPNGFELIMNKFVIKSADLSGDILGTAAEKAIENQQPKQQK